MKKTIQTVLFVSWVFAAAMAQEPAQELETLRILSAVGRDDTSTYKDRGLFYAKYIGQGKCDELEEGKGKVLCEALRTNNCASLREDPFRDACSMLLTSDTTAFPLVAKAIDQDFEKVTARFGIMSGYLKNDIAACNIFVGKFVSTHSVYSYTCSIIFSPDRERIASELDRDYTLLNAATSNHDSQACSQIKDLKLIKRCFSLISSGNL